MKIDLNKCYADRLLPGDIRKLPKLSGEPEAIKNLRRCLKESAFKVVYHGEIIGVGVFDERHERTHGGELYIAAIYVKPQYRRQGVGTLVYELCIEYAKQNGFKAHYLDFDWGNPGLVAFYDHLANLNAKRGIQVLTDVNGERKQYPLSGV